MRWNVPNYSALSYQISQERQNQPIVIFADDLLRAEQLQAELTFFLNTTTVNLLPDWETLPYDHFSPHEAIISDRILCLAKLQSGFPEIFIIPIETALGPFPDPQYIRSNTFSFSVEQSFNLDLFRQQLIQAGYHTVNQVMAHGEFVIRGGIIDLFAMGAKEPIRIELFDNHIETLRTFDPDTQRTSKKINTFKLFPAREFPLDKERITLFRNHWRERFSGNPLENNIYQSVSEGIPVPGIEYYLPLFFEKKYSVMDYLPDNAFIIRPQDAEKKIQLFYQEIHERYEQLRHDIERPLLAPNDLFLSSEYFFSLMKPFKIIRYEIDNTTENNTLEPLSDLSIDDKSSDRFHRLAKFTDSLNAPLILVTESEGRQEVLEETLSRQNIATQKITDFHLPDQNKLYLCVGDLYQSFSVKNQMHLLSEQSLYQEKVFQQRRRKNKRFDPNALIRDLSELQIGDPVVHIEHGIGQYQGLTALTIDEVPNEFITLLYANDDKIYVPVTSLELISRFPCQDPSIVAINKLGQDKWNKAKRKALEKIHDTAVELLEIYARRESKPGFSYELDHKAYQQFSNQFKFETTPDQQSAIDQVLNDLQSPQPMDRLICGDVGFGKTEVAMRACFAVIHQNRQVAILAPTTLLAHQHYENFKDRFAYSGANIDVLSRFKNTQEQNATIKKLAAGQIDIIIGTHKLIQPSIHFHNLGLIIIDEEHRFGVKQKEVLKNYRSEVDILALTATPIPRSLNMALSSIRDISIIATPPEKRLSVKTFVNKKNPTAIQEAIKRELHRGGQVFFLHNDINTIESIKTELIDLVPEAKIAIAHGQMRESLLERIMQDFYHRRYNLLVCTTIIENGIDIPTANTIIINRADHFGLSQLHQLRGRVGRSNHQAYAYLIVPDEKLMTADAKRRLEAIQSMDELGSGFILATHDLEIRGAGELLGEEQSGHIQTVGFQLYMELLEKTVNNIKSGKTISIDQMEQVINCEINLHLSAIIPEHYMPNIQTRLNEYKRISDCKTRKALNELQVEFIDRFGLLPEPTKRLFTINELKIIAESIGIKKIDFGEQSGSIDFEKDTSVEPEKVITLIQTKPATYRLKSGNRLMIQKNLSDPDQRINFIRELLTLLCPM